MILSTYVHSLMKEIMVEIDARAAVNEPRASRVAIFCLGKCSCSMFSETWNS